VRASSIPIPFILAAMIAAAGCGSSGTGKTAGPPSQTQAAVTGSPLDGIYTANLASATLAKKLAPIKPSPQLPGGWWALQIDTAARTIDVNSPEGVTGQGETANFELGITGLRGGEMELAPDTSCEQAGPGRLRPARLAWSRSGPYLRLRAISVPCLTDAVLLTSVRWSK